MIDIVIVNWNAGQQLENCIDSITRFGGALVDKVIVVDNGSVDGSENAAEKAPNVTLIRVGENLGFAKACNLGAARGSADLVLFLNPDAQLLPGSLSGAQSYLQFPENESVGIVGVRLIGEDGAVQRSCARFPSPILMLAKSTGLASVIRNLDFHMHSWPHDETKQVDHVIGAFYLIRRSLFEAVRGFDERFFVYLEDLDLSYRAAQLGYRSVYLADAQAFHKGGGVSDQVKAHRLFYSLRSRILYAFKHFTIPSAILVTAATLAVEPVSRLMFLLLRGRMGEVRDLGRAYKMLWGWVLSGPIRGRVIG